MTRSRYGVLAALLVKLVEWKTNLEQGWCLFIHGIRGYHTGHVLDLHREGFYCKKCDKTRWFPA